MSEMIPRWNDNGKKAGGDIAGLMLPTDAMIADVQDDTGGEGGMGSGMGMGM